MLPRPFAQHKRQNQPRDVKKPVKMHIKHSGPVLVRHHGYKSVDHSKRDVLFQKRRKSRRASFAISHIKGKQSTFPAQLQYTR